MAEQKSRWCWWKTPRTSGPEDEKENRRNDFIIALLRGYLCALKTKAAAATEHKMTVAVCQLWQRKGLKLHNVL